MFLDAFPVVLYLLQPQCKWRCGEEKEKEEKRFLCCILLQKNCVCTVVYYNDVYIRFPLELDLVTSELWFGQEQEGILPELLSSSSIV